MFEVEVGECLAEDAGIWCVNRWENWQVNYGRIGPCWRLQAVVCWRLSRKGPKEIELVNQSC